MNCPGECGQELVWLGDHQEDEDDLPYSTYCCYKCRIDVTRWSGKEVNIMPEDLSLTVKVNTNLDEVEAQLDRILDKAKQVKELTGSEVPSPSVILD